MVAGNQVWTRPEDNATAAGTHIYTWSSGDVVFLLIGVDDAVNRALIEQLPGEPAPTPTPLPSASEAAELLARGLSRRRYDGADVRHDRLRARHRRDGAHRWSCAWPGPTRRSRSA